jgi:hypothetical protein
MNHFSADEWVDFTRGLLPPAKAAAMQAALDGGCSECRSSFQLWRAIGASILPEGKNHPSQSIIKTVKDAYASEKPWKWIISAAQFAQVIFDSFREPTLAGVRAAGQNSRQITVETDPFVIDLQLESDPARHRVSLTGQILNSRHSQAAIDGADVVLLSSDNLLRRTKANELGEFCLDFGREQDLRLFINIRGERAIGITLPDLENHQTSTAAAR